MNMWARRFLPLVGLLSGLIAAAPCVAQKPAQSSIKSANIDYSSGEADLEGFVAFDGSKKGPLPGILIVPDWMGVSDYDKGKALELAKEGYVAFVVDVYGVDSRPKDTKEAGELATKYKSDRALLRERMKAALDTLKLVPQVDKGKIVAIGYCFGGTAALELARSGAPLAGTVSFHGGLSTPNPADAKNIKAPVLALHGADDPFVPPAEVEAFKKEMKDAGVKLTFVPYKGAVHAFTHPSAGNDNSKGAAYNAEADKESWKEFEKFLGTVVK